MTRGGKRAASGTILALILCLLAGFSTAAQVDTAIEIITSPVSPVVGQSVTVTWRLTAQTGSLVVFSGDLSRCIKSPASGSCDVLGDAVATSGGSPFSTSSSFVPDQAGTYTIEGGYPECPGCSPPLNGSSKSMTLIVVQAATTTTVTLKTGSNNPSVTGESVTFTATVEASAPGTGTPTGTVTFKADGTAFATAVAMTSGVAEATTSFDAVDSPVAITAEYSGDTNYNTSNNTASPYTQNINKANTTTTITGTDLGTPTDVGVSYTVSGTVTPANTTGTHTTAGSVEVSDGTDSCTDAALVWNASGYWDWSCSLTSTTAGTPKTITATYSGDDNYSGDADTDSHTVNQASTTVDITSDLTTATVVGESYTVSGTVTPANTTGTHTTAGSVEVSDGTDSCTDVTLVWDTNHWDWSCVLTSTTAGAPKTITATYSGDDNYSGDADTDSHTVNQASTTVAITSVVPLPSPPATDGEPSVVGQSYIVSGTVTPVNANGTHTTTGDVEVSDATDTCTDATLVWDTDHWDWSCVLTSTTVGTPKTLTATYSGDDNYGTDDDTESHTVNKASTTVTITSVSPSPAVVGQTYTVSGTVDVNAPGDGTPTGTVTVGDGLATSAAGAVAGDGSWSCNLASTTVGSPKTLTATYAGDSNYTGDTDTESHTVNKADTTTTVTVKAGSNNPSVTGESVTFTATVASVAPGSGTPADGTTVDFEVKDKDANLVASGSPTLSSGAVDFTVGAGVLAADKSPYTVTATFNPTIASPPPPEDPNYNSSSGTLTQNVNKASTTVAFDSATITVLGAATDVGESYTVSGTVAVDSPGSLPLTGGTVTVSDGTESCTATLTLATGVWTCSAFVSKTAGTKTITATYSGDDNYTGNSNAASHTVDKTDTTVAFDATTITALGTATDVGESYTVSGTVTPDYGWDSAPTTGTVQVSDGTDSCTDTSLVWDTGNDRWDWSCNLASTTAGSKTITAIYSGDPNYNDPATDPTADHTVNAASATATELEILGPGTACAGQPVLLIARVTDPNVTGSGDYVGCVTWTDGSATGTFETTCACNGDCSSCTDACCVVSADGECSVYYTPAAADVGTITITAQYKDGTANYADSDYAAVVLEVDKRDTATIVLGSDTPLVVDDTATCTVTVSDASTCAPSIPTGDVTVIVSPSGAGTLTGASHTLIASDAGQFTFTYTPSSAANTTHTFTATYAGSDVYNASSGSFGQAVVKRSADLQLTLNPTTAYIGQNVVVNVRVEDDTSAGTASTPTGTVTFDDGGKNGTFTPSSTATLSGGECTVTYTPAAGDAGTTTITATYSGSSVHFGKSTPQLLTVNLRPTETRVVCSMDPILVNQSVVDCTVTVVDIAAEGTATPPNGTIVLSTNVGGTSSTSNKTGPVTVSGDSQWEFDYVCTGLNAMAGFDLIQADFTANDGIHESSTGGFAQAIQRRPTVTTLSNGASTADGVTCTATTEEDSGNAGTPVNLTGNFIMLGDPDTAECSGVSGASPSCNISADVDAIMTNVSVRFDPTDKVHLPSTGSLNIDRSDQFDPDVSPGDASTCDAGCGDGGIDIEGMIYDLNLVALGLHMMQMGLEGITIVTDFLPDIIVGAGFGVISGATIPISDIASAITGVAGIALEIAITAMTEDLDGDGLPGVIELRIGTSDGMTDSDEDGMGDADEISWAGGYFGGSRRLDPTNPDSDGDGLYDGDEVSLYHTDPCVADTDCDTLTDGEEVGTWSLTDERDHSDPLLQDTDGDGIRDDIQYASNSCMYINEADSDDDGLEDGTEDWNADGVYAVNVAGTGTQASTSWESNPCDFDTDGDGLSDGEEFQLLGGLNQDPDVWKGTGSTAFILVSVVTPTGVKQTIPALDTDSDDDGLSDYEEVNITGTDPLDADSDDDGLNDDDEVYILGGTYPNRTFDQESDPLDPDTDDDGLRDDEEFPGGTVSGTVRDTACPYVNDDDSDDDGLKDGTESWDGDNSITTGTIGNSLLQADTSPTGETDFCNPDTDGDGLTDGEEVALLGGLPVDSTNGFTAVTPQGVSTTFGVDGPDLTDTVPPLDDDSDNDGLSDYEEVNITHTDPLDADSDNDTLSDANELIATGGTWPNRTFIQVSDPLDPDTDDDDLHDQIEYPGSGLGLSRSTGGLPDNVCPYVNDDDSDDDGLQDGVEDANHDGTWGLSGNGMNLGGFSGPPTKAGGASYWETDLCNPDTDGDGLLDGEEVGQLGGKPVFERPKGVGETFSTVLFEEVSTVLPVGSTAVPSGYTHPSPIPGTNADLIAPYTFLPVAVTRTLTTVPALDVDSDDDGLSDYEEVNITGTDPLDQDSDNDTLMDSDELIATGGITGATPRRTFDQESNPLDINTDDDHLFDPQEYAGSGLSTAAGGLNASGVRDIVCPFVNDDDSDDDGIQDGAVITLAPASVSTSLGAQFTYTHYEDFIDLNVADVAHPGVVRTVATSGYGEQQDDALNNVCDRDSDGDGLTDGEEIAIGTDPNDWDTDDDGRNDWHEVTGGGPIPTDPFDPDTDDDGLLDSAEVFGSNNTNPLNADTDGDGLCDGGARTPWMTSGDARVVVNPICKSCATPGDTPCATPLSRLGSPDGIGDHPNPIGIGEDEDGEGDWDLGETDPNQYDTDGDALADGIERLSFSTTRQQMIPTVDLFGRPITVVYPEANNTKQDCGCLDPLDPDSDDDGLSDGYEDANHDGNFDFLPSDFEYEQVPLPGPPQPNPNETNPCDPDTDHDGLTDWEERVQRQPFAAYFDPLPIDNDGDGAFDEDPVDGIDNDLDGLIDEDPTEEPIELTFNPTNPLDHDTDNDRIYDGPEVKWVCVPLTCSQLDNDTDALINEDPIDGIDNDGDGLIDEDPVDFTIRFVPMLDPTNRDSDSDGYLDGLDDDPCNSECIPVVLPLEIVPVDTDGDGFSDEDEIFAGTHPNDPEDHPIAFYNVDMDFDQWIDDRVWLEPILGSKIANSVVIDIDNNVLIDFRLQIAHPRDVRTGDFDGDGDEDDIRYVVEYAFANYRVLQPRIVATIDDYNADLIIDWVIVERK